MNKKTKNITVITSCALMLLGIVVAPQVTAADEIRVSGNGSNSNNSVSVTTTQQSAPQQTNNSQVTNNTNTSVSTGNNTASSNTGASSSVQTGNANVSTTVNTSANASSVNQNCCNTQGSSAAVTGNGENSINSVNVSSSNNTAVTVNQNANVTNNVSQDADTGHNTVSGNGGNVSVKTGDITAQVNIKNGPINVTNVSVPSGAKDGFTFKVAGNSEGSVNVITNEENSTTVITVNNSAIIINNLKTKYITGENTLNSNNGNVSIATGGISSFINILNGPINASNVEVTCCKQNTKSTLPPTSTPSGTVPSSSSSPSSSGGSGSGSTSGSSSGGPGSVLGASANNLPVTGSYWFFIALIGNILVMLMGGYLRLRSGRSPGYAFAL